MSTDGDVELLEAAGVPEFGESHKIEETVKVYLELSEDGTKWEIDHVTLDGYGLDGKDDGPTCDLGHDDWPTLPDEEKAANERCDQRIKDAPGLPDADDLLHMLADALGYDLTER